MAEPTLERLESAFMNAHKAGDKKAAGVLAAEIKRRRAAASVKKEPPTTQQEMMSMPDEFTGEATPEAKKFIPGVARELAQGLTFGGAGELVGAGRGAMAALRGEEFMPAFQAGMSEFEEKRKEFKKEYPASALTAEIAGSLPTALAGGALLSGTRLFQAAPRISQTALAAGEGGLYGLLSAEGDIEERLPQAGVSMAAGGLLRGAGEVLPRVTEPAKRLISEKIQPTVGQSFGPLIKAAEERLAAVPLLGDVIKGGQREVVESFDNRMIEGALSPINFKVPAGKTGVDAMEAAEDALSAAFREATPKAGMPDARPLQNKINEIVQNNTDLPSDIFRQMREKLNKTIGPSLYDKNYRMSGEAIKKADSALGKQAITYIRTGDPDKQQMGRALFEMQSYLRDELIRQNPEAKALSAAREAYKNMKPVRKAATSAAGDVGLFTPAQMLRGMKSADVSIDKTKFATGKMPQQELAMTARDVIGKTIPEDRSLLAAMALKPSLVPISGIAGIAAQPFYQTELGRRIARNIIQTPGAALRASTVSPTVPAGIGGLLAEQ